MNPPAIDRWILRLTLSLIVLGIVLAVALVGVGIWFTVGKPRADLQSAIAEIRSKGEPLDGSDLNAFYAIPPGAKDSTAEFVAALRPLDQSDPQVTKAFIASLDKLPVSSFHFTEPASGPPHRPQPWPDLETAEEAIRPLQDCFAALDKVVAQGGEVRYPVDCEQGLMVRMPQTLAIQKSARPLEWRVVCQYHRHELPEACTTIVTMLGLVESLKHEPMQIAHMVRFAAWFRAVRLTSYLAADPQLDGNDLLRIQRFAEASDFRPAMLRTALGQRALVYQTLTKPVDDEISKEYKLPTDFCPMEARPGDCAQLLSLLNQQVEYCRLPLGEVIPARDIAEPRIKASLRRTNRGDPRSVTHAIYPNVGVAVSVEWFLDGETLRRSLMAFCAVERYRREHGGLPDSLEQCVPKYLQAVPEDPVSGRPLRYLRRGDQYAIYGVGCDQEDDGGDVVPTKELKADMGIASYGFARESVSGVPQ